MLVTTDTKTITAVLASAITTTQPTIVIAYAAVASSIVEAGDEIAMNGATPVTLLAGPGAGIRAVVKSVFFTNLDTVTHTVTVSQNAKAAIKKTVPPGGSLDLLAVVQTLLGGTGTANRLTKWVDGVTLGDSRIIDVLTGSTISIAGAPTAPRVMTFPDASMLLAGQDYPNVFTPMQTIDRGAGALPAPINAAATSLVIADGRIQEYITFANSGIVRIARCADGTRAVPTPVPNARAFMGDQVNGWDGSTWSTAGTSYAVFSDGLWSGVNHGYLHSWSTVPNGSITSTETMRLQNGAATLGNIAAVAGSGLLQLASGTTKANAVAFGTDAWLWRQSAGVIGVGDSATGGSANAARHGLYFHQGGYANPGAYQTDNNGDKLVLYRGDAFDARIGVGASANMWYLAGAAGAGGGLHEFYTAASAGSAVLQFAIGQTGSALYGTLTIADAKDITLGTATGSRVGTSATQKLGFWNATPVVQPQTTGTAVLTVVGLGTALRADSTSTGTGSGTAYSLSDVILNLKAAGILKT